MFSYMVFLLLLYLRGKALIMKRSDKLLVAIAAVALTAAAVYVIRQKKGRRMRHKVSEEGYETAHDVLFPNRGNRGRVHYGPVLPE